MARTGARAVRFRISQRLRVLQEFAAQSEFLRTLTLFNFGALSLLLSVGAAPTERKGRCRQREVRHCGTGEMWMGQDVWCSTSGPSAHIAALSSGCLQT